MGAAWKVDAILTVITEATFKDRECCDGRELRRARPMTMRLVSWPEKYCRRR